MPMLPGSAALAMMEGEYDSGAVAVSLPKALERLGSRLAKLDRDRPYLGILDELYGVDAEVWPLPEVLLTAAEGQFVVRTSVFESRRNRTFVNANAAELYQMVTVGRHYYRALTAVKKPEPPSAVAAIASGAVSAMMNLSPATTTKASQFVLSGLTKVYGGKGRAIFERLKQGVRRR